MAVYEQGFSSAPGDRNSRSLDFAAAASDQKPPDQNPRQTKTFRLTRKTTLHFLDLDPPARSERSYKFPTVDLQPALQTYNEFYRKELQEERTQEELEEEKQQVKRATLSMLRGALSAENLLAIEPEEIEKLANETVECKPF
jgi:hypothetical protein